MKLLNSTSDITKAIVSIEKRGAKLDSDIQLAAVSIIAHVDAHGDTTLADRLIVAMPKGSRKLALVEYLLAFGKMRVLDKTTEKDAIAQGRFFAFAKDKTTDMEGAMEKQWHEFKPEPAVVDAFDVQAAVHALLKRVKTMQEKGVEIQHSDLVAKLAAIA